MRCGARALWWFRSTRRYSPEECGWVLGNCGAVAVIVEDAAQLAKIDAVRDALPALRMIFIIEAKDAAAGVLALDDVATRDRDDERLSRRRDAVAPDALALIIYTSGTTGLSEGLHALASQRDVAVLDRP